MLKRFFTIFLALSLVIGVLAISFVSVNANSSSASAHSAVALTSVEDNDFPGSYVNHRIHLHPNSTVHGALALGVSGSGFPPGRELVLGSDITLRCTADGGLSGTIVTADGAGNFVAGPFAVVCTRASTYLVVAIDRTANKGYNAILTLT